MVQLWSFRNEIKEMAKTRLINQGLYPEKIDKR